jgi:hypothetical protein
VNAEQLRWYVDRARCMSAAEIVARTREQARRQSWRRLQVLPGSDVVPMPRRPRPFPTRLDPAVACAIPAHSRSALCAAADRLLAGDWETFGVTRNDLEAPDWFLDPLSGRRAPSDRYAFKVRHRSEAETGNIKQIWELSRHQHLTMLAAAFFVTGDERYAERTDEQLRSWWSANPFLSGVHWTSGIEVGMRLVAWTWIRRLLDGWHGVTDLFESNEGAVRQIFWHQRYLAGFPSAGSSANNHVIAEAAGQLVAACAFPWFDESAAWRDDAIRLFQAELKNNTFPSGVNRELASEYHGFVTELAYVAALEADAAGIALEADTWARICRMTDAAAALTDATGRPPRQGDGDDAVGLLLAAPETNGARWSPLLALGAQVFGALSWWSIVEPNAWSVLLGSLVRGQQFVADRPARRPDYFADAGITLLRSSSGARSEAPEMWCRCDSGPHGFLSTAAHAHADALAIEVRHAGVDILADPGTYCYHGEPEWRSYFRSTAAHNTLEIGGRDQSDSGGPFLWTRTARTNLIAVRSGPGGEVVEWCAEHDGYKGLSPAALHRRTVHLDAQRRALTIDDHIDTEGTHELALNWHLGPAVSVDLCGSTAQLRWRTIGCGAMDAAAVLRLPDELSWSVHCGETDPVRGWYSPRFGVKTKCATLTGVGSYGSQPMTFRTALEFER